MIRGIIYLVSLIIIVGFLGMFFLDGNIPLNDKIKDSLSLDSSKENQNSKTDNIDSSSNSNPNQEENLSGLEGGGGGSGEGSGGGGSESSSPQEIFTSCPLRQISYSLKNFNEQISCIEYNQNGCFKLEANCSVNVYNLDSQVSGNFELEIKLIDISSGQEIRGENIIKNIGPEENDLFGVIFNLENSLGVSDNVKCDFKTITIPKKEYC